MINNKNSEADVDLERSKRPKAQDVNDIISETEIENIAEEIADFAKRKYRLKYILTRAKNAQLQAIKIEATRKLKKIEAIRKLKWHVFIAFLVCVVGVGIDTFRRQSMEVEDAIRYVVSNEKKSGIPSKEDAELYGQVVNEHKGDRLKIIDSDPDKKSQKENETNVVSPHVDLQSSSKNNHGSLDIRMVPENVTIAPRDTPITDQGYERYFEATKAIKITDVLEKYEIPKARIAAVEAAFRDKTSLKTIKPGQQIRMWFADFDGSGKNMQLVRLSIYRDKKTTITFAATDNGVFVITPNIDVPLDSQNHTKILSADAGGIKSESKTQDIIFSTANVIDESNASVEHNRDRSLVDEIKQKISPNEVSLKSENSQQNTNISNSKDQTYVSKVKNYNYKNTECDLSDYNSRFNSFILQDIWRYKDSVALIEHGGWIEFETDKFGRIRKFKKIVPSDNSEIDKAVMESIKNSEPFLPVKRECALVSINYSKVSYKEMLSGLPLTYKKGAYIPENVKSLASRFDAECLHPSSPNPEHPENPRADDYKLIRGYFLNNNDAVFFVSGFDTKCGDVGNLCSQGSGGCEVGVFNFRNSNSIKIFQGRARGIRISSDNSYLSVLVHGSHCEGRFGADMCFAVFDLRRSKAIKKYTSDDGLSQDNHTMQWGDFLDDKNISNLDMPGEFLEERQAGSRNLGTDYNDKSICNEDYKNNSQETDASQKSDFDSREECILSMNRLRNEIRSRIPKHTAYGHANISVDFTVKPSGYITDIATSTDNKDAALFITDVLHQIILIPSPNKDVRLTQTLILN